MNINFIKEDIYFKEKILIDIVEVLEKYLSIEVYLFDGADCQEENFIELNLEAITSMSNSIREKLITPEIIDLNYLKENLNDILISEMEEIYYCERVWTAWSYGTMTMNDFIKVYEGEDFEFILNELNDKLINNFVNAEKKVINDVLDRSTINNKKIKRI